MLKLRLVLVVSLVLAMAGCNDSTHPSSAVLPGPSLLSIVQRRDLDTYGTTVQFTFDTTLLPVTIRDASHYVASVTPSVSPNAPNVLAIFPAGNGLAVRVTYDKPVIPGETTFNVSGLRDFPGNLMTARFGVPLSSTDRLPPTVASSEGRAISNAHNDVVTVQFDDLMIESDVEDYTNFSLTYDHSLFGTRSVDLSESVFDYSENTQTLNVRLENQLTPVNLQINQSWRLTMSGIRDMGGNPIGTGVVTSGTTFRESDRPFVLNIVQNTAIDPQGTTVDVMFNEVMDRTRAQNAVAAGWYRATMASVGLPGSTQSAVSADVVGDGDILRLQFNTAVVPLQDTLSISRTVSSPLLPTDLAGNEMSGFSNSSVSRMETDPPGLDTVRAETVSGPFNDFICVKFDEPVLPVGATTAGNYQLTTTQTGYNTLLDSATNITYDRATRTAKIILSSQSTPINLHTFESYTLFVSNVRDVAGNFIPSSSFLSNTTVQAGDATRPGLAPSSQFGPITQNTNADPLGETIDIAFTEVLDGATIALGNATYTVTGGTAQPIPIWTDLLTSGDVVRVKFDGPVVPGTHSLAITNIEDLAGNVMNATGAQAVKTSDNTPPGLQTVRVTTFTGQFNDTIEIEFNEPVLAGSATVLGNFSLTAGGNLLTLDPDNLISYDQATRTTTIVLASRSAPVNLTTGDAFSVTANQVSDVGGNVMSLVTAGGFVGGDTTDPRVTGFTVQTMPNAGNDWFVVNFDEEVDEATATDFNNFALIHPTTPTTAVDLSKATFAYTFDGPTSQVRVTLPVGINLASAPGLSQALKGFTLTVGSGLKDHAGNGVDPAANGGTGTVGGDVAPPSVSQATQQSSIDPSGRTIDLTFSEEMSATFPSPLTNFVTVINKPGAVNPPPLPTIVSASLIGPPIGPAGGSAIVRVVFDGPIATTGHNLRVQNATDLARNPMTLNNNLTIDPVDLVPPTVMAANSSFRVNPGHFNDVITVVFDSRVIPSDAVNLNNFLFSGAPLDPDNIVYYDDATRSTVIVLASQTTPVNLQKATQYTMTVSSVRDLAGNPIGTPNAFTQFPGGDATGPNTGGSAPVATQKTTVNPAGTTVWITFDEALDPATAENTSNYTVGLNNPLAATLLRNPNGTPTDIVELSFVNPVGAGTTVQILASADLAGNAGFVGSVSAGSDDLTQPIITSAAAATIPGRQNDVVLVTFSERVLPGEAITASNFQLFAPANAATAIQLGDASFAYSAANNTTTITLSSPANRADLQNDPTNNGFRIVVNNVHDVAGRVIQTGVNLNDLSRPVSGDNIKPFKDQTPGAARIVGGFPGNDVIEITFSEEVDPVSATNPANWTFPGFAAQSVLANGASVKADGRTVRLVTSQPNAAGEKVDCVNVKDLAGNVIDAADPEVTLQ